jgi:ligand-binding SRPBCC domain-containing protein
MRFVAESVIAAPPERVFAFHELPDALERLLPPWEHATLIQHAPSLRAGSVSIVKVRVVPLLSIRIESEHTAYDPPRFFQDEMRRGPFRRWVHQHRIEPAGEGARLIDTVDFELPFGPLLAPLFVLPRLRKMFAYRHEVTRAWCVTYS